VLILQNILQRTTYKKREDTIEELILSTRNSSASMNNSELIQTKLIRVSAVSKNFFSDIISENEEPAKYTPVWCRHVGDTVT